MNQSQFNQSLLAFLETSPTPFHATANMAARLALSGYTQLNEGDVWQVQAGGKYFVTRNDSSIIAFKLGTKTDALRMVGAHTDSPCLKVKPRAVKTSQGYVQLGAEVYGGALLGPWFDRELSLAGRVHYLNEQGEMCSGLVNAEEAIAIIPSLAIHLDREVNAGRAINPETQMAPVVGIAGEESFDLQAHLASWLRRRQHDVKQILDYELYFYDCQPPAMVGFNQEFIASGRLDNLLSCFIGLQGLLQSDADETAFLICTDHEEVGSTSCCGAAGPFLQQVIERLYPQVEERNRILSRSWLISADNAHAVHPNFADKHENNHKPMLNKGPVIKTNANQRYATTSETASLFRRLCDASYVSVQDFVSRADFACGSTIGPITSAELGIATVDIGVPQLAMHSCRELAGSDDAYSLFKVLKTFYNRVL